MFTVTNKNNRFPFSFPCKDTKIQTVTCCLSQLFAIFVVPSLCIVNAVEPHLRHRTSQLIFSLGVLQPPAPLLFILQKIPSVKDITKQSGELCVCFCMTKKLNDESWHAVLQGSLHSIRSSLCTSTNSAPLERFFNFLERSIEENMCHHRLQFLVLYLIQ